MKIDFLGHSCFRINEKGFKILIDPFAPDGKTKLSKQNVDVVLITHEHLDHNYIDAVKLNDDLRVFRGPGEYEVSGIFIRGIESFHDEREGEERGHNTIFTIGIDDITLCHLGDLGTSLEDNVLEDIGAVDVLMVPVGGTYTINAKQAAEVVNMISPKIVIPMHAKEDGFSYTSGFDSIDDYISANGTAAIERTGQLDIKAGLMPLDRKIVIMERVK